MVKTMEFKTLTLKADELNEHVFKGYGSIFGNVDSYGDIVVKSAFARSIGERGNSIPILWQHDTKVPIGKASVKEDDVGLYVEATFAKGVQAADEAYRLAKAQIVNGLSIGFNMISPKSVYSLTPPQPAIEPSTRSMKNATFSFINFSGLKPNWLSFGYNGVR